jgi:hypothetical protein
MSANDTQVGGSHYKNKAIQPWDFIAANGLGYLEGNVVKYVSRWQDKDGAADLYKALHYLEKLIEISCSQPVERFDLSEPEKAPLAVRVTSQRPVRRGRPPGVKNGAKARRAK